jgi:hypothetical protein
MCVAGEGGRGANRGRGGTTASITRALVEWEDHTGKTFSRTFDRSGPRQPERPHRLHFPDGAEGRLRPRPYLRSAHPKWRLQADHQRRPVGLGSQGEAPWPPSRPRDQGEGCPVPARLRCSSDQPSPAGRDAVLVPCVLCSTHVWVTTVARTLRPVPGRGRSIQFRDSPHDFPRPMDIHTHASWTRVRRGD